MKKQSGASPRAPAPTTGDGYACWSLPPTALGLQAVPRIHTAIPSKPRNISIHPQKSGKEEHDKEHRQKYISRIR